MLSLLQLSHSGHLGSSPSHAPQLSTPVPISRHQMQTQAQVTKVSAAAEFFDGISRDMSSTSRGPIPRQQQLQQQQHLQRLGQELAKVSLYPSSVQV